jgi:DNA-binding NtrC family response regulator
MTAVKDIKVLLVDDEETLIEYVSKRLLREGFTVRAASSGEEAIAIAEAEDFDTAIVDLKMPGMDGIETLERLKEVRPFLQCIVLTGYPSIDTAIESERMNVLSYLHKPAEHEVLMEEVQKAAAKKREIQRGEFLSELQKVITSQNSPLSIKREVDLLRRKYGMD